MDFNKLSNDAIVTALSASAERNDRVWAAGVSVLRARGVWPTEDAFDAARSWLTDAMLKGLSAEDQKAMAATAAPKAKGVVESVEMAALREQRVTIQSRLRQRVYDLRDKLFPSLELLTQRRNVKFMSLLLPTGGFSALVLAPSKSGKTTLVRQLVTTLLALKMVEEVVVLSETAHVTGDFGFLVRGRVLRVTPPSCLPSLTRRLPRSHRPHRQAKESVKRFSPDVITALMAKQSAAVVGRKHVLIIVDDVLGLPSARNCTQLMSLFAIGRNLGISIIVLSQSLKHVTVPVRV